MLNDMFRSQNTPRVSKRDKRSAPEELPVEHDRHCKIANGSTEFVLNLFRNIPVLDKEFIFFHECAFSCLFEVPPKILVRWHSFQDFGHKPCGKTRGGSIHRVAVTVVEEGQMHRPKPMVSKKSMNEGQPTHGDRILIFLRP
jgi:hypothetical protein